MKEKTTEEIATPQLAPEYQEHFRRHAAAIRQRLREFHAVPPEEYFFELCYCLLTPGSRALHAERVMVGLRSAGFPDPSLDPTPFLRNPHHYIRFHNQKAERLRRAARQRGEIEALLGRTDIAPAEQREWLVANVSGLGWKEASHFLRNIGHHNLAIIDRHVLKHLLRCGAIDAVPVSVGTRQRYLDMERRFQALAASVGLSLQELDLLFWSFEEGSVRK